MLVTKTPGVYIQEISTLPASIAGVATAIPAFIGYTDKSEADFVPTRITSLLEYQELFGGAPAQEFDLTIDDEYDDDEILISRVFSAAVSSPLDHKLYHSLELFFNNGGSTCYIISVGRYTDIVKEGDVTTPEGLLGGIAATEKVDEPTLLVFPDAFSLGDETKYGQVVVEALTQCNKLQDRFTICDAVGDIATFRGSLGINYLKYGAAYHPSLKTTINYSVDPANSSVVHTIVNAPDVAPDDYNLSLQNLETAFPSIYRSLEAEINKAYVELPASGAIAGIYARVDRDRGVWKAPANVSINSVLAPAVKITHEEQADLNIDPTSGKSINAIRSFAGKGILVWGARTLAGNDNEWRYVPVRRLYIFIEESVKKATEFVVFEPNDRNTWIRVKAMIENFLTGLWRDGALAGAKPEDAFFVKVGLGETMTAQDILEGRMNVEIGLAAVRPAEFIILKFSHKLQES